MCISAVTDEEQALEFIKLSKNGSITLLCFLDGRKLDQVQRAMDDGGKWYRRRSNAKYLKKNELKDVAVVLTRYFGGTKLGGLVQCIYQGCQRRVESKSESCRIINEDQLANL